MIVNHLLDPGERYVAIFRNGLPMIIQFRGLKNGDLLLLNSRNNGKYQEVYVSYHNADQSGEDWFVHDPHFNAYFAEDCDHVCKFDCSETPEYILSAMIKLINAMLAQYDNKNARCALESLGCNEQILRKLGFGFLFDHVGI